MGIGICFPTRMTVVRLPDGALWIHSPVPADPMLLRALAELGPVRHLVAPSTLHYWWLADWHDLFPDASLWGPAPLAHKARRKLPPFQPLGDHDWPDALDQLTVSSSVFEEVVFFHRQSRTLILADLIENFELPRVNSHWQRFLIRLGGVAAPAGKAPLDMQISFWRHRDALLRAVRAMLAWQPERIVLAHGAPFFRNGGAELRRAFGWVL